MGIAAGARKFAARSEAADAHADAAMVVGLRGEAGARISALAAPSEEAARPFVFPGPNEPVTFTQHIKPLFRKMDRESMSFVFDLWSHGDVSSHSTAILKRLESGTMPCDGAWPKEKVDLFRRWIESGMVEG